MEKNIIYFKWSTQTPPPTMRLSVEGPTEDNLHNDLQTRAKEIARVSSVWGHDEFATFRASQISVDPQDDVLT